MLEVTFCNGSVVDFSGKYYFNADMILDIMINIPDDGTNVGDLSLGELVNLKRVYFAVSIYR